MVIDSNSTRRSKDDRGGNNSRKNSDIRKGESSPVSASANTVCSSLRRLTRGTAAREQITSTSSSMETPPGKASNLIRSNMRKSKRHEKNYTTTPVKRKLEVLERGKTSSSPLRRSDRGKKHLSLVSSDSNNGKVTASPDDTMKKSRGEKRVKRLTLEAMETTEAAKKVKRSNCGIKKRMNGHTYKLLFAPQRIKEIGPELGRAEKLSQDDRTRFGVSVSNPVEDGFGVRESIENIEEECIERDCEGGKEQSISKSNNSNAIALSNHRELETLCWNSKYCSWEALGEPSQENAVNSFNGITIGEEIIDDSESLQVDHASVVELRTRELERLADDDVEEGTDVSLLSSECKKDHFVGTCASCCKRRRLNKNSPTQELCLCSTALNNDFLNTSRSKDGLELARCDDSHNDALNDSNLNTFAICKHDRELLPDSSRFVEYWVPVSSSNVQLEQYCATLLSNSTTLRASSWSKDIVGALHDILVSAKKCCDHPYFVDSGLQGFLTKDLRPVDYLGVGIKASGKLQILDTVLSKIKSRGKRVIILYQSTRYAGMLTGDILDDFLRQRFGLDSYERVDGGIVPSRKQAALNKFNDKKNGRFVFLLEKRACTSAIKLSSVDAIVIFDSDWNVKNDYRALTKLSIDSSLEPIKMFRLYTSCTLEEKVLDLATNQVSLDSNPLNITRITCHRLLMWGASYLFSKLDEFHGGSAPSRGMSLCSCMSMQNDVAGELLDIIIHNGENSYKNSLIIKVQHTGGTYCKTAPLLGQLKFQSTDGKVPHLFWAELLECKNPRWKFLPMHSPRSRKRVQYLGDLPKPDGEPDDVTKKQKKTMKNNAGAASLRTKHGEGGSLIVSPRPTVFVPLSPKNISPASEVPMAGSKEEIKLCDLQKNLHSLLKPAVLKLSESLQIPDDMKSMGEIFLDYIVNNHQISSEPESILQAFQISLIWITASLLRYNLDRRQSLDVAKQHLGFRCTEEEVINVYSKLRPLKKTFQKRSQKFKELESKKFFSEDRLKQIQIKCEKRKMKLLRKHEEEIQEFNRTWEKERTQIENDHKAESAVIRAIYFSAPAVRLDKLKRVDDVFTKKINEHKREKELRLQELRGKHLNERTKEDQKADSWLQYVQENVVSVLGEKQCLNRTETSKVTPSTNPITTANETVGCSITIEIPAMLSHSLHGTGIMEKQLSDLGCFDIAFGNNSVSGNHPSTAEQIPDGTLSVAQETENVPNEFAGCAKFSDPSKPDGESSEYNNLRNDTDISDLDPMGSCSAAAGCSKHDAIYTESPLVTWPLVQIPEAPAQDVASLQNLAHEDETSRLSISAGILDGDAPVCENTDSLEQAEDNNHPTAEQIPDFTTSDAQETDENAPKEFAGGAKFSDTSKPDGESDEDNNLRNDMNISDSNRKDAAAGCSRDDGTSAVLPLITSLPAQILKGQAQEVPSLQNLAPQEECSTSSTSAGIGDGDTTGCNYSNNLEQAEVERLISAEAIDHANDGQGGENSNILEQAVIHGGDAPGCENTNALEQAEVEHLTSAGVTAHGNDARGCEDGNIPKQVAIHDGDAIGSENTNALKQAEVEHPTTAEVTAHTNDGQICENSNILEQTVVPPLHPTSAEVSHLDSCAASSVMDDGCTRANDCYNGTDLIEGGPPLALPNPELTKHHLPHVERPPSQNGEQPIMESRDNLLPPLRTQVVDEVLNHDGTPPTDSPIVGLGPHHPSRPAQQMNLRAQPQPFHSDPLHIELERLHRETEEATKLHEDAKLQLRSEYDKELEVAIAEIRRKYEAKHKAAEAEYLLKKKELDANHNKVFMNRILAETFRTKCLEFRPSTSGMYQGQPPNFLQQLLSLSSQPRRTSAVSGSTSVIPPAASQQSSVPSVPALQRSSPIITSTQMRQPRTLPNNHPIGNSPISGEMRAPAPHLRPLLSTSAPSSLSASQGLPGQDSQRQPPFSTVAQVRPRLPLSIPPRQSVMQLPCQPVHHDRVPQPEFMGICNPSIPAVGSLNVENLPGGCPPNVLPREPSGLNFVGLYHSQGEVQGGDRISGGVGGGVNLVRSSVLTDVVCLSDDE